MTKNKHNKHKGVVAPDTNATPINELSEPEPELYNGDTFDKPIKSGNANVKVSGIDLLQIVNQQYTKLAYTPTMNMPKTDIDKLAFCKLMATNHYVTLPNGYMAFDVVFLAKLHTCDIDETNYNKGSGLQCYITCIGGLKQKCKTTGITSYKPHGLARLLIDAGYSFIEQQHDKNHSTKRDFMGRSWVIRKSPPSKK